MSAKNGINHFNQSYQLISYYVQCTKTGKAINKKIVSFVKT